MIGGKSTTLDARRKHSTATIAAVFLLPVAFFLFVYLFRSIFHMFQLSGYSWSGISRTRDFIGWGNWQRLLNDQNFFNAIGNNLIMVFACLAIQIPVGLLLAYIVDWANRRFKSLKLVYFLPLLMSAVAIGFLFKQLYDARFGLIGVMLGWFMDIPFNVLSNEQTALWAVIAVICWQFIPFYMLYFFAGLTTIPEELYEASIIDGAKRHQYIFRVSLPLISGVIKNASILCLVGSLKYFDLIYVMTEGGPAGATELMATYMYKTAFTQMRMGYGATVSSGMFIIITIISLATFKIMSMNFRRGGKIT